MVGCLYPHGDTVQQCQARNPAPIPVTCNAWGQGAAVNHNHRISVQLHAPQATGPWGEESRTLIFTCILPKYPDCRAWTCSECNFSWAWIDLSASARLFWIWAACLDTEHPVVQYLPSEPPQFLNQLFRAQTPDPATKPRLTKITAELILNLAKEVK